MTNRTAAKSSQQVADLALAKLRMLAPSKRFGAFRKLSAETQHLITEPCSGEVHTTGADGCMVCLNTTWGRMLKRSPEQLAAFPASMR